MSEPMRREWRLYVDDMIEFAGRVLTYTQGFDQARFVASALVYDATLRNLELIGEAATRIPPEVRDAQPRYSVAHDRRDAQPADSWVPGDRRRHALEPCPRRCSGAAAELGSVEASLEMKEAWVG